MGVVCYNLDLSHSFLSKAPPYKAREHTKSSCLAHTRTHTHACAHTVVTFLPQAHLCCCYPEASPTTTLPPLSKARSLFSSFMLICSFPGCLPECTWERRVGQLNCIKKKKQKKVQTLPSPPASHKEHVPVVKALQALQCLLQQVRSETSLPVYLPVCQHPPGLTHTHTLTQTPAFDFLHTYIVISTPPSRIHIISTGSFSTGRWSRNRLLSSVIMAVWVHGGTSPESENVAINNHLCEKINKQKIKLRHSIPSMNAHHLQPL